MLRKAALKHALTGSLATFMIILVVFFVLADLKPQVGWVGLDSGVLMLVYLGAVHLLQNANKHTPGVARTIQIPAGTPNLVAALVGFTIASGALVYISPILVRSSIQIAEFTGLGTTFVGTTLVALVTSLPEAVTTISAARIGASDMAIGNLFGSNLFNMFALGITDIFYLPGRFLGTIDPTFLLIAMLGAIMTGLALIGNVARIERRLFFVEVDAALLILVYFGGMWLLFARGIG
jgi:cation:H+ antiporter